MHRQSAYKPLPPEFNARSMKAVSVPIHLPTALGDWIHMSVVENDQVPDPRDIAQVLNAVKEHTVLIYNTDGLNGDLSNMPFNDLVKINENEPVEIRIHSLCRFGDALYSQSCDCGPQLFAAMRTIMEQGAGIVFYLDQEGRNAGLTVKTAANHVEQVRGIDTSQTFQSLGLERNDFRNYDIVVDALNLIGISKVRLMSNNPAKIRALANAGIEVVPHPIHIAATRYSGEYLAAKREYMGHSMHEQLGNGSAHAMVISMLRELLPRLRPEHMERLAKNIDNDKTSAPESPGLARGPS